MIGIVYETKNPKYKIIHSNSALCNKVRKKNVHDKLSQCSTIRCGTIQEVMRWYDRTTACSAVHIIKCSEKIGRAHV